jgi:long-chain acyl-CoA synthetase
MNISRSVECGRRLSPDKPALIFGEEVHTYGQLEEAASRVADGLSKLGVGRGERVALFLPNSPSWVYSYLGILKIGAVAVSLNSTLKAAEAGFILDDCGAKAVVTTESLRRNVPAGDLPLLEHCLIADGDAGEGDIPLRQLVEGAAGRAEAVEMEADSPAAIVYTSGTTGFPKGAVLTHGNVVSNVEAKIRCLGIRPDDRLLLFLPLFHCFGQNAVLNSGLGAGATLVLHHKFDASEVLRSIRDDGVTMVFGVPTTFILLCEQASAADMRSVRYYFSAAACLPPEIERRWQQKFGLPIHQGYGLTETSPFASYNHQSRHKPGSIGTPIEGVEMKVVDPDDGRELPPEAAGEILVRGPNVMLGYWNRPDETARVIKDGWFHTGDIGRADAEGYFYIEDRLKDMVNVGGLKVYPAEVENVIYQHPSVSEAAVYGLPDPLLGESVAASVVLKPGLAPAEEEIVALCRRRLSAYKVPSAVEFVASLPKNPSGKILKRVLREEKSGPRAGAAPSPAAPPAGQAPVRTAASIQSWLKDWLAGELQIEATGVEVSGSFSDYGVSSVGLAKLTRDLGLWLGRPLDLTAVWSFPTVESLTENLSSRLADGPGVAATPPGGRPRPADVRESDAVPQSLGALTDVELAELLQGELSAARQRRAE